MRPYWRWALVAFFFFAGLGLALWEETSWIGIGQIWMAVAVLLALLYIVLAQTGGSRVSAAGTWSPKPGGVAQRLLSRAARAANAAPAEGPPGPNTTAKELERLERLRRDGDLSEDEYLARRERILAQV